MPNRKWTLALIGLAFTIPAFAQQNVCPFTVIQPTKVRISPYAVLAGEPSKRQRVKLSRWAVIRDKLQTFRFRDPILMLPEVEEAIRDSWMKSVECRCEIGFAVEREDNESILIRQFGNRPGNRYEVLAEVRPATIAEFHTHPDGSPPSQADRMLQRKFGIPFYVIHERGIQESK